MTDTAHPSTWDESPGEAEPKKRGGRERKWWIIVLVLLLLLLWAILFQLVFPDRRGPIVQPRLEPGLSPVFAIYGLNAPRGVSAGPDGEFVVSDTGSQKVFLYDNRGVLTARLGGDLPDDRVFSVAGSLHDGEIVYVTDWGLRRVWLFSPEGSVIGFFPENPMDPAYGIGGFFPKDIQVAGDDIFVASRTGVFRFDATSLELEGRFGEESVEGNTFDLVTGIEVDEATGRLWAVDSLNRRVVAYDPQGNVEWVLGRPDQDGEIVSFFALPRDILLTERGLLVSDAFRHELYLLDMEGNLLGSYGERGVDDGQFNFPEGMALAPDGLVYVADRANDRVQALRLGEPLEADRGVRAKWEGNHVSFD